MSRQSAINLKDSAISHRCAGSFKAAQYLSAEGGELIADGQLHKYKSRRRPCQRQFRMRQLPVFRLHAVLVALRISQKADVQVSL